MSDLAAGDQKKLDGKLVAILIPANALKVPPYNKEVVGNQSIAALFKFQITINFIFHSITTFIELYFLVRI